MSNNTFYNPYHFVPLDSDEAGNITSADTGITAESLYQDNGHDHARHDHLVPGLISGTLTCKLNTLTPTITGAEHTDSQITDGAKIIEPFRVNHAMAIAGSSLRGMVSSTYEIVTNSAMRVLDDTLLNGRVSANKALPAIGQVFIDPETNEYSITPLLATAGCIRCKIQGNHTLIAELERNWRKIFGEKVLWNDIIGYYTSEFQQHESSKILKEDVNRNNSNIIYHSQPINTDLNSGCHTPLILTGSFDPVNVKEKSQKYILTSKKFDDCSLKNERPRKERAIAYILSSGRNDSEYTLPFGKKHHWIIPYSEEKLEKLTPIPVDRSVIEEWREIATLIHDQTKNKDSLSTPYLPMTQHRDKKDSFRDIQNGDLIYFGIDDNGKINKVSYSSIWRDGYRSEYDYLGVKAPLAANSARSLTPAETLFGFVSEAGESIDKKEKDRQLYAGFASRVLFSNATAASDYPAKRFVLPELSAPKAPSPAMYFGGKGYVSKQDMNSDKSANTPGTVQPSGWKRYIPHHQLIKLAPYQEGKSYRNRSAVQPIPAASELSFTIDIKNLSEEEFRILLFCLSPQDYCAQELNQGGFTHSLGMGKPLGLGRVRISVTGFKDSQLPSFVSHTPIDNGQRIFANWTESALAGEEASSCFDANKAAIMMKLGSTDFIQKNTPIHYPKQTPDRHPGESHQVTAGNESFRWFVQNDRQKGGNQHLERLTPDSSQIKPLAGNKPQSNPGQNQKNNRR